MKNNYPIKYAVIPIKEYNNKYGEEIVCYIISKVYLISEELRYDKDGDDKTIYNVIAPYEYFDFNIYKRVEPIRYANGFHDVIKVDKIFDNPDIAIKEKEYLNSKLLFNKKVYRSMNSNQRELLDAAFNNTIDYYNDLEDKIEINTPDLIINATRKPSYSIIKRDNEYGETIVSIYEVIQSLKDYNYKVYSLNKKDYNQLLLDLGKGKDTNKYNKKLLIINNGPNQVAKVMSNNDYFYLNNGVIYNDKFDDVSFDEDICDMTYYTTETYDELLKSYPNVKNNSFKLERKL